MFGEDFRILLPFHLHTKLCLPLHLCTNFRLCCRKFVVVRLCIHPYLWFGSTLACLSRCLLTYWNIQQFHPNQMKRPQFFQWLLLASTTTTTQVFLWTMFLYYALGYHEKSTQLWEAQVWQMEIIQMLVLIIIPCSAPPSSFTWRRW